MIALQTKPLIPAKAGTQVTGLSLEIQSVALRMHLAPGLRRGERI